MATPRCARWRSATRACSPKHVRAGACFEEHARALCARAGARDALVGSLSCPSVTIPCLSNARARSRAGSRRATTLCVTGKVLAFSDVHNLCSIWRVTRNVAGRRRSVRPQRAAFVCVHHGTALPIALGRGGARAAATGYATRDRPRTSSRRSCAIPQSHFYEIVINRVDNCRFSEILRV